MSRISESYESGNKKRHQETTRKLKMSVSCESGNKNKKKKEVKHEKVTVSYESVRKNQQDSSCYEEAQKKCAYRTIVGNKMKIC